MIESEKILERKLNEGVKKLGGWSIKLPSIYVKGLPDRICLFPEGRVVFVEMKTTGKKPTDIQEHVHGKIRSLGFRLEVIDTTEKITNLLNEFKRK